MLFNNEKISRKKSVCFTSTTFASMPQKSNANETQNIVCRFLVGSSETLCIRLIICRATTPISNGKKNGGLEIYVPYESVEKSSCVCVCLEAVGSLYAPHHHNRATKTTQTSCQRTTCACVHIVHRCSYRTDKAAQSKSSLFCSRNPSRLNSNSKMVPPH